MRAGRSLSGARGIVWQSRRNAIALIVYAAMLFNAVLALVNANVGALNSGVVIACEAMITALALAFGVDGHHSGKARWIAMIVLIVGLGLANGLGSGAVDPKLMRDALLIPVFILLGLSSRREDLIRIVMWLQVIVVVVMLFEAIAPIEFGKLFNVMSYYINTRGFQQESFWNTDSDLFVSATRPGERFLLSGLDIHRLSSVFLEPVSLGNYCVLVVMITVVLWSMLSNPQRLFLTASSALVLVGCDGRFAAMCIIAIVGLRVVAPVLPRYCNWIYLPGVLGVAALAMLLFNLPPGEDNFVGRTAGSIDVLSRMSGAALLGYAGPGSYGVMDSGIAYLLYSQSLCGAVLIWSFIALGMPQYDRASRIMLHAASLYFGLNLLISYSVFSIKTAALLWFAYGVMGRDPVPAPAKSLAVRSDREHRLLVLNGEFAR